MTRHDRGGCGVEMKHVARLAGCGARVGQGGKSGSAQVPGKKKLK